MHELDEASVAQLKRLVMLECKDTDWRLVDLHVDNAANYGRCLDVRCDIRRSGMKEVFYYGTRFKKTAKKPNLETLASLLCSLAIASAEERFIPASSDSP